MLDKIKLKIINARILLYQLGDIPLTGKKREAYDRLMRKRRELQEKTDL